MLKPKPTQIPALKVRYMDRAGVRAGSVWGGTSALFRPVGVQAAHSSTLLPTPTSAISAQFAELGKAKPYSIYKAFEKCSVPWKQS